MMFLIGLIGSTAFYGIASLLVAVFAFGVDLSTVLGVAGQQTFMGIFCSYLVISIPTYVVYWAAHFIGCKIIDRGGYGGGYASSLPGTLAYQVVNPFKGLVAPLGARRVIDGEGAYGLFAWAAVIVHFVWAIASIAFIAVGLACLCAA